MYRSGLPLLAASRSPPVTFYATRPPAVHVSVAAVTRGDISRVVLSNGVLEPTAGVDVGSQVSGTIQSLLADFNDLLKAGQIIAQIDPAPYRHARSPRPAPS